MPKPLHTPDEGWDRHSIKAELHRQGMTLSRLAELSGSSGKAFSKVWTSTHRKAETAISEFLETPASELFPNRYPIRASHILSSKYEQPDARANSPSSSDQEAA